MYGCRNWLRRFIRLLDMHVLIITTLTLTCTFFCTKMEIYSELPMGLIGLAVVFPIVFSINAAYKRREGVLKNYSKFKGLATSLYIAHRDWPSETDEAFSSKTHDIIEGLNVDMWKVFSGEDVSVVYDSFSCLSQQNEELRNRNVTAGEISRMNQYLMGMVVEFESMKAVYDYRTPQSLRAYSKFFLNSFPIFFAPHFASLGSEPGALLGYEVATLYSVVLVCLDNVQDRLENPFDQDGEDDIQLDDKWCALQ